MAGLNELLEGVPPPGRGFNGKEMGAAVAPGEAPVALEHGHQLHRVHPQVHEVGHEAERVGKCARRGDRRIQGTDVQLVDDEVLYLVRDWVGRVQLVRPECGVGDRGWRCAAWSRRRQGVGEHQGAVGYHGAAGTPVELLGRAVEVGPLRIEITRPHLLAREHVCRPVGPAVVPCGPVHIPVAHEGIEAGLVTGPDAVAVLHHGQRC